MQKLQLQPVGADEPVAVSLERAAPDHDPNHGDAYLARIGDASVPVKVERTGAGAGWLTVGGKVHHYHVLVRDGEAHIWLDGSTYKIEVIDRTRRRGGGDRTDAPVDKIVAPMPGTVLKINVTPGDTFDAHQPLVIIESMKMEMTLSAPTAGTVKDVRCKVGELVPLGTVLVALDVAEADDAS
jgi:3-methylcrotonyl-CoA carboxylase alpha subunit